MLTRGIFIVATTLVLTGCGREDALDPASPQQHRIVNLFWGMTAGSAIGFAVILGLLALGWRRRSREGLPFGGDEATATKLVVILGIAVPIVVLSALFVWSDVFVMNATSAPDPKTTKLTVEVVGHQFWWEARYPGSRAVTANEIHIPSGTRVNVVVTTADVIHSFWIPQLNRKIDMIPGKQNRIVLEADRPGRYRGQCYEFCGLQHAHMGMVVVAQPPAQFRAWLANMAKDARPPVSGDASRGRSVFLQQACSGCHQIRGTRAHASVGPDLTHLETRQTIAGVELPNTHAALERWVRDPQHEKPGVRMPALPLSDADAKAVVDYLESLR